MDDLMAIGEFSERSGMSPKRLRTYAAEGLLVPTAVDPTTGYRYYSAGQVHEAQVIDALRHAAIPLADIRILLRDRSDEQLDAWARRLDTDAADRQKALARARKLMGREGASSSTREDEATRRGAAMATLRSASRSETGPVRENNEDIVVSSPLLLVVADGMGGTPGGEVAANTAVALVQAAFTGRSSDELEAAVRAANWAIWDQAAARSDLSGMGTTICAVGLVEDARRLAVIHVGDSRAYLWHNRQLLQLTRDHTVTADLVSRGELREEEASQHPHFGILTRALGVAPEVEVDSASRPVVAGDRLLLCSDGLVKEVSDGEIADAMGATQDVVELADTLVGVAIARGGRDNISLLVGEVAA